MKKHGYFIVVPQITRVMIGGCLPIINNMKHKVNKTKQVSALTIIAKREIKIEVWDGKASHTFVLKNYIHMERLTKNRFSVPSTVAKGVDDS